MAHLHGFGGKAAATLALAGLILAGCASTRGSSVDRIAGMTAEQIAAMPQSERAVLSQRLESSWQRDPRDVTTGVTYAEFLTAYGRYDRAYEVMKQVADNNPSSGEAQLRLSEAEAALGYYPDALRSARTAERLLPNDWQAYSQEGLVLDQLGKPIEARMRYRQALTLSRDNPEVLSNMATSYVLTHDLAQAENYLRQAVAQRNASPDVRVNLALVLALQGKREEAQRVAMTGVTPEQARQNIDALNAATAPGGAWQQYSVSPAG